MTKSMNRVSVDTSAAVIAIRTLWDATQERYDADAKLLAKEEAVRAKQREIDAILRAHPEIGTLNRATETAPFCLVVYYVNFPKYREAKHPSKLI